MLIGKVTAGEVNDLISVKNFIKRLKEKKITVESKMNLREANRIARSIMNEAEIKISDFVDDIEGKTLDISVDSVDSAYEGVLNIKYDGNTTQGLISTEDLVSLGMLETKPSKWLSKRDVKKIKNKKVKAVSTKLGSSGMIVTVK